MTAVATLLRQEKRTILTEWTARVRQAPDVPVARRLSLPALVDSMPDLIDDLIECLQSENQAALAERVAAGRELGRTRAALAHATNRTAEGYSVRQALLELSLFRMVVMESVASGDGPHSLEDMMIVHAAIDEAMWTCADEMLQVNVASVLGEANARREILRVVSHDLRNPLSTVLFSAESLAASRDELVTRKAAVIVRNSHRMRRLIDDLGDVNAMETGSLSMSPRPERVSDLLRDAIASQRVRAVKKNVALVCDASVDVRVHVDAQRLQQVLDNLIGNALEVLAPGGHVWLSAAVHDEVVMICVRDDGPGIDAAHQQRVFDRFWRAPDSRYAGSGLGLAISRGIIEALGGRIWVESRRGHGAAFCFTLPVVRASAGTVRDPPAARP